MAALDEGMTELQIRWGIKDKSKIIFLISQRNHFVTPHQNRLDETVLMMGLKICFNGKIWRIIPKLSQIPILIWSTGQKNKKRSVTVSTSQQLRHSHIYI